MVILDQHDYQNLFVGSAFFSCGGGVPYKSSISLMDSSPHGTYTQLVSLDEFSDDDWLCTVYAIGASGHGKKRYESFLLAIECLETQIGKRINGIVPGEIGSEVNAVWVASQRHIALVDADMAGGRAVPEEQMDMYGLKGISSTPVIVVNDQADVIVVNVAHDLAVLEEVYRAFAVASGGYCYIAGRPIKQGDARQILSCGTISRAISTGKIILSSKNVQQVIESLEEINDSRLLAKGQIIENRLKDTSGFLAGLVRIKGSDAFSGNEFDIHYKNENIILLSDNECLCSVPDLITIVDARSRMPMSNNSLQEGSNVLVFGTSALPVWRTPKGIALLGPMQFGFHYEYKPLS